MTRSAATWPARWALARLVQNERVNELDAEHWISQWEREAEASGRERDEHYWGDVGRGSGSNAPSIEEPNADQPPGDGRVGAPLGSCG